MRKKYIPLYEVQILAGAPPFEKDLFDFGYTKKIIGYETFYKKILRNGNMVIITPMKNDKAMVNIYNDLDEHQRGNDIYADIIKSEIGEIIKIERKWGK